MGLRIRASRPGDHALGRLRPMSFKLDRKRKALIVATFVLAWMAGRCAAPLMYVAGFRAGLAAILMGAVVMRIAGDCPGCGAWRSLSADRGGRRERCDRCGWSRPLDDDDGAW